MLILHSKIVFSCLNICYYTYRPLNTETKNEKLNFCVAMCNDVLCVTMCHSYSFSSISCSATTRNNSSCSLVLLYLGNFPTFSPITFPNNSCSSSLGTDGRLTGLVIKFSRRNCLSAAFLLACLGPTVDK